MPTRREALAAKRQELGFSQEGLAERLGVNAATIARWERGRSTPRAVQRPKLAAALQITLPELERVLRADGQPQPPPAGHSVPGWLSHYASLEQGAARLQTFEPTTVPGLLQTEAYTRAVMRSSWPPLDDEVVEDRVEARQARQAVLERRPQPLELICIIDETALERRTGSDEVMAEQLDHLRAAGERPTIRIQICRSNSPALHSVPCGSFRLFTSGEDVAPFMVCTEGLTGFNYLDGPTAIEAHVALFEHLTSQALPPEQSAELLQHRAERYRHE